MSVTGSYLSKAYRAGWGNFTDLYQLTMAYGYWKKGMHKRRACFNLFFRKHPFKGGYTVAAGLALVIDYLQKLSFSAEEVQYLGSLRGADGQSLFSESFLHYLQRLQFTGSVYAIPEGNIVFPHEPLIRIEAPLLEAQLIETALLNLVNFSSLVATKAARVRLAAGSDEVLEFGLRRAQGPDGGLLASRSAYLGGCDATSNVRAGQYLGIPVRGTHAHSWVMVFESELAAFEHYADSVPNNCVFLVDTYNTIQGVKNAIEIGYRLNKQGHKMLGIRLDSGDLADLSKKARVLLDEAGFEEAKIVASNDLDEYRIRELKDRGARIDTWGVGTRLVTAYDQPALGGVYKLAALTNEAGEWEARAKLSEQAIKVSNPGRQQVRRFFDEQGAPISDMIYGLDNEEPIGEIAVLNRIDALQIPTTATYVDLLELVMENGEVVQPLPHLAESRTYCLQQLRVFEDRLRKPYLYGLARALQAQKDALVKRYRQN